MDIDRTTRWLFTLFRSAIILLSLNAAVNSRPLSLYYPSTVITYRLDAWSQYENPEEGYAREGDILDHPLSRKTTTRDDQLLWPGGLVPYFVDELIVNDPTKLAILEDAMENIMELTCVKFVRIHPNAEGEFPAHTWINITGSESGCFADLGRSTFGPSILNLDVTKCFRTRGHALHEILHTLGVYHEHMRPDRDEYINIVWNNVRKEDAFNFHIMEDNTVTTYGLPYDYDSIMHYSMTAFSRNKSLPTIVPLKNDVVIGQRSHLSVIDVKKLLIAYKCSDLKTKRANTTDVDQGSESKLVDVNKATSSAPKSEKNNLGATKALRDYQSFHSRNMYKKLVPSIRELSYELLNYPEYDSDSLANDYLRYLLRV